MLLLCFRCLSTCLECHFVVAVALHELLLSGGCVCSLCSSFGLGLDYSLGFMFFFFSVLLQLQVLLLLYLGRNLHLNYIFLFGKYKKETNFVCAESEMNDLCANFNLEVVWLANGSH